LEQRGYPIKPEDVEHLSAYMTEHLQRFGDYTLKLRPVASGSTEEALSPESHTKDDGTSEEISA